MLVQCEEEDDARLLAAVAIGGLEGIDWLDKRKTTCNPAAGPGPQSAVLIFGFQP
jgi:hypothetical protein